MNDKITIKLGKYKAIGDKPKQRVPVPKPSVIHKDKTKYDRKSKCQ